MLKVAKRFRLSLVIWACDYATNTRVSTQASREGKQGSLLGGRLYLSTLQLFSSFPPENTKKAHAGLHTSSRHTQTYTLSFSLFSTYPSKLLASEFLSLSFSLIRCSLQQSSFAVMNTQRRTAAQASSSPKSDSVTTPMTTTTTMSPLNLSPSSEQLSVQSMPVPRKQHSAPSELPAQHTLKPPSLRPKLNTILSSDASRFMSLEKLQQNMKNTNPHQERQLTIETAVFPEQQSIFNDKARRGAPQVSQALLLLLWLYICFYQRMGYTDWYICLYISYIRAMPGACAQSMMQIAINNTTNDRQANVAIDGLAARNGLLRASSRPRSLLEIWAMPFSMQMVREGGFVVEDKWIHILIWISISGSTDSDELESFVYHDNRSSLYPVLPSFQWASESYVKRIDAGVESFNQHKPRRPVLRSAVSELPSTALLHSSPFHPKQPKRYQDYYTSDADEESALLHPRGSRRKRHRYHMANKR